MEQTQDARDVIVSLAAENIRLRRELDAAKADAARRTADFNEAIGEALKHKKAKEEAESRSWAYESEARELKQVLNSMRRGKPGGKAGEYFANGEKTTLQVRAERRAATKLPNARKPTSGEAEAYGIGAPKAEGGAR